MEKRTFGDRFKVSYTPQSLDEFTNQDSPWHESAAKVEAGLAWGEEKARLLKWVRKQMRRRLTPKQRRCIELYYFQNLTYRQVGKRTGCCPSSACRAVQRGIHRLRAAARLDPPEHLRQKRGSSRRGQPD